jgi:hypothetical protein
VCLQASEAGPSQRKKERRLKSKTKQKKEMNERKKNCCLEKRVQ